MDFDAFSDEAFAAYLAGFTDGEGYIGIEPAPRSSGAVRIILANCVPEVLRGIQARLGYGRILSQHQKEHWRERFTLAVGRSIDCEHFLRLVRPYLQIKADVADRALARIGEQRAVVVARHERNQAILTAAQTGEQRKDIAARFGVSPQMVSRICEGHNWPSELSSIARRRGRNSVGYFVREITGHVPPLVSAPRSTD